MGGADRPGGDGPRVLAVVAGAAEPRYLLRRRRPPDGAHRYRPRGSMTQGASRRFPIRYAIQRWKDGIWFYGSFFIILMVLVGVNLLQKHPIASFIPVLLLDAGILVTFWLMRTFSYVETSDEALRVRYLFRHVELPYTALSRVRRQPLEVAFQPAERRRFVNRFVRRLAKEPAAYIRLDRRQRDLVEHTERQLGPRLMAGGGAGGPPAHGGGFVPAGERRRRGAGPGWGWPPPPPPHPAPPPATRLHRP